MVSRKNFMTNTSGKGGDRVATGLLTGAVIGTTAVLLLTSKNGKALQSVVKEKVLNGSSNKGEGRSNSGKERSVMSISNPIDLLSAAQIAGHLSITLDTVEFPKKISKRSKNAMTARLFPGEEATILDRFSSGEKYSIPRSEVHANNNTVLTELMAQQEIKKAWERAGGYKSVVGLPLDINFPVFQVSPGRWALQCRSGRIEYSEENGQAVQIQTTVVNVELVAIECQKIQESLDDVYGVISVHGPANELINIVRIAENQPIKIDRKVGPFVVHMNIPLAIGIPVQDLYIQVSWIENDSGNVKEIAREVATIIENTTRVHNTLNGFAGEFAAATAHSLGTVSYGVSMLIFGDVFGTGDDAYPLVSLAIKTPELLAGSGPSLKPAYQGSHLIGKWTHDIIAEGTDDGGSLGKYRFYFQVTRADTYRTIPIPI